MKKKITTIAAAMAMSAMMVVPAFASNYSGTYFYFDDAQSVTAPNHAQACVTGVDTDDNGDGTTEVKINVTQISHGNVTGEIASMTIDGDTKYPVNDVITFDAVDNSLINDNGLTASSITLTISGHPVDLSNIYLDTEE